jgi:hypothetical protein
VLQERRAGEGGGARRYCTSYSTKYLKEAINALERKKVSPDLFNVVAHEMREILDPHISAETPLHWKGPDPNDKRIGQSVYRKLQKEYK